MSNSQRWVEYDRYGNLIYMTEERWQHALEKRPWLAIYFDEIFDTIRQGRRQQDPLNPHKYKYYRAYNDLMPEFNHLVIVIIFGEKANEVGQVVPNNYVSNVWAVYIYSKR